MNILKYSGPLAAMVLLVPVLQAQNARLVLSGGAIRLNSNGASAQIVLQNANWENNASAASFVPGTGTVLFSGGTTAQLGGTQNSAFYNLTSTKSGAELQLNRDISVSNLATLGAGDINLQNAQMDLLTTGSLSGEVYPSGSRVYCADNQNGRIRAVRSLTAGANNNIAGLALNLTVSGAAPGSATLFRGHDRQTSTAFVGAGTSIGRYYDITPAVSSGYTYTFDFRYHELELYGMAESNFLFYRSPSYGVTTGDWEEWGGSPAGPLSPGYPTVGTAGHNSAANVVSLSGINSFSRWTLSNALTTPLPVELGSFTATCDQGQVQLQWTTVSEVNNAYFTIERSADSQNWQILGGVAGAGNSNSPLQYSLTDPRPFTGISYYRLRQTDYNGDYEQFAPFSIPCDPAAEKGLLLFPNPADQAFTARFIATEASTDGRISLFDMTGRKVSERSVSFEEGSNEYTQAELGIFMPGVYTVRISTGNKVLYTAPLVIRH